MEIGIDVEKKGEDKEKLRAEIQNSLDALTDQQNLDFISAKISKATPGDIRKMVGSLTECYNKDIPELMKLKDEINAVKGEESEDEMGGEMTREFENINKDKKRLEKKKTCSRVQARGKV